MKPLFHFALKLASKTIWKVVVTLCFIGAASIQHFYRFYLSLPCYISLCAQLLLFSMEAFISMRKLVYKHLLKNWTIKISICWVHFTLRQPMYSIQFSLCLKWKRMVLIVAGVFVYVHTQTHTSFHPESMKTIETNKYK